MQRVEDLPSQQLVSQLSIEGFHVPVFPGAPGLDEQRADLERSEPVATPQ